MQHVDESGAAGILAPRWNAQGYALTGEEAGMYGMRSRPIIIAAAK